MILFFEQIFRVFKLLTDFLLSRFSEGNVFLSVVSQAIVSLIETVEYLVPGELFAFVLLAVFISLFIRFFLRL